MSKKKAIRRKKDNTGWKEWWEDDIEKWWQDETCKELGLDHDDDNDDFWEKNLGSCHLRR